MPHGGSRPGSGRPTLYEERMFRETLNLPASYVELAKLVGHGNLSAGI